MPLLIGLGQIEIGFGMFRINVDGSRQRLLGLCRLPLRQIDFGQIVQRLRILRLELHGMSERLNSFGGISLFEENLAQQAVRLGR